MHFVIFRTDSALRRSGALRIALSILALALLHSGVASAQTWNGSVSNDWFTGANWNGNVSPTNATDALISSSTNNPVTVSSGTAQASTLTLTTAGNSLNISSSTLQIYGGSISNAGSIGLNSYLQLENNLTLSGSGTLTMAAGQIGTNGYNSTLSNQSTIQGYGLIGSNAGPVYLNLSLNNSGTINANSLNNTLTVGGDGGSITNTGLLEATGGGVLSLSTSAAINNVGGNITALDPQVVPSIVNVSTTIQGGTFNTAAGGIIQTSGTAYLNGSSNAITISDGSTYTAGAGTTQISGTLNLGTVSGGTLALSGELQLVGNATLTGPGSVTMAGGQIGTNGYGYTLTNQSLIQGSGLIGSSVGADYQNLSLNNSGTINANLSGSGNSLTIGGTGGAITNSGLLEATNGGTLVLSTSSAIDNSSGNITANGSGSTVQVSTTIQGGTLNTLNGGLMETAGSATLDASAHAITISDGSTYTAGLGTLTSTTGTLNLGTSTGGTLALGGQMQLIGDTTLSGPGVVTMVGNPAGPTGAQIGTNGYGYTLTLGSQSTIQGSGLIGSNSGSLYQDLSFTNNGLVNANSTGNTLQISGTGTITNNAIFEATNGGTLLLSPSYPINNGSGSIIADGAGSTVLVQNTTIQGGTLTTSNGGAMQTVGTSRLDGTTRGAITLSDGSTYTSGASAFTEINGTVNLGTATGSTLALGGQLQLVGDTTLTGPGTITMSGNPAGPTGAQIGTNGYGYTLTLGSQNTIQGSGLIGSNSGSLYQDLSFTNNGLVNANSNGNTLQITGTGTVINNHIFEATNGGTLTLSTQYALNNGNGTIIANGSGSNVLVQNTIIQGGTLTTLNGGAMQTAGVSQLDGSTHGAITLSDGSTYTSGPSAFTRVDGALNLGTVSGSNLALSGQMQLVSDTTLSGPGSLTLAGAAQIGTNGYGYTLTNNATIQGNGLVGSNVGSLYQNLNVTNGGIIDATGGTLNVAGTGLVTNTATGTLEAQAGSTLHVSAALSATDFSGGTLSNGSYEAFGGNTPAAAATLQIDSLGSTGGEITSNAANIVLSGADANLVDGAGLDALTKYQDNLASGSFTVENGQMFSTNATDGASFSNAGAVDVGAGSSFTTGGYYTQTGGTTIVDGALTSTGGQVNISGGTLSGTGTINAAVNIFANGTISPGDAPGTIHINGDYMQAGTLDEAIASASSYDAISITGSAALTGASLDVALLAGYLPANGVDFVIMDAANGVTGEFALIDGMTVTGNQFTVDGENFTIDYTSNPDEVILDADGPVGGGGGPAPTPEPSAYVPLTIAAAELLRRKVMGIRKAN